MAAQGRKAPVTSGSSRPQGGVPPPSLSAALGTHKRALSSAPVRCVPALVVWLGRRAHSWFGADPFDTVERLLSF